MAIDICVRYRVLIQCVVALGRTRRGVIFRNRIDAMRRFASNFVSQTPGVQDSAAYDPRLGVVFGDPAFSVYLHSFTQCFQRVLLDSLCIVPTMIQRHFRAHVGSIILTFLGDDASLAQIPLKIIQNSSSPRYCLISTPGQLPNPKWIAYGRHSIGYNGSID